MKALRHLLVLVFAIAFVSPAFAQDKKVFVFEGSQSCKKCHLTKKSGAAFKIWESSKHAQAFTTLGTEEAKAIAKKMGIEDPQKSDKCLSCHVTAHGVDAKRLGAKFSITEGVGCEACHGPGSEYNNKDIKEAVVAGKMDAKAVGLIVAPTEADCKQCHNEKSPTYKPFKFEEAMKKIAHPTPKE